MNDGDFIGFHMVFSVVGSNGVYIMGFYSMNQFNLPGYIHGNMWIRLKIIHEVVLDYRRVTKKKLDLYNIEELQPRKTRELNIKHGSSLLFIVFLGCHP